jgi:hypothetical protein
MYACCPKCGRRVQVCLSVRQSPVPKQHHGHSRDAKSMRCKCASVQSRTNNKTTLACWSGVMNSTAQPALLIVLSTIVETVDNIIALAFVMLQRRSRLRNDGQKGVIQSAISRRQLQWYVCGWAPASRIPWFASPPRAGEVYLARGLAMAGRSRC